MALIPMFQTLKTWTSFLDPMRAEVHVQVTWSGHPEGEARGRILGPKSPFATTIEVAYPLKVAERGPGTSLLKGTIPEPSWWTPETGFFYDIVVELWNGTHRVCKQIATHQLRGQPSKSHVG